MSRLKKAENRLAKFQNDLAKLSKKHGIILREIGGYYIIKEDDKPLIKNLSYSKPLGCIDKKIYERSSFFVCQENLTFGRHQVKCTLLKRLKSSSGGRNNYLHSAGKVSACYAERANRTGKGDNALKLNFLR